MIKEKIDRVIKQYSIEAKRQFDSALKAVILFGFCARGDYDNESDIDILVLLDLPPEKLPEARKKMRPITELITQSFMQ